MRLGEKLKDRLDHLETLAAFVTDCTGAIPAAAPGAGPNAPSEPRDSPSNSPTTEYQSSCLYSTKSLKDHSDESSVVFSDLTFSHSPTSASFTDVALWDSATSMDPSHLMHNEDIASVSLYWVGHVDCGCHRPHIQVSSSAPKEYRDQGMLDIGPDLFTADPYLNTLRVERICLAHAIFSNCLQYCIPVFPT